MYLFQEKNNEKIGHGKEIIVGKNVEHERLFPKGPSCLKNLLKDYVRAPEFQQIASEKASVPAASAGIFHSGCQPNLRYADAK